MEETGQPVKLRLNHPPGNNPAVRNSGEEGGREDGQDEAVIPHVIRDALPQLQVRVCERPLRRDDDGMG